MSNVYHGWAFGVHKGQMDRDAIRTRFKEIESMKKEFEWGGNSCYAHNKFTAKPLTEAAKELSSMDVLILADYGNLCFGGECSKRSDGSFYGSYNTD